MFSTSSLNEEESNNAIRLLYELMNFFEWSYKEILRLYIKVVVHKQQVSPKVNPNKHSLRYMHLKLNNKLLLK